MTPLNVLDVEREKQTHTKNWNGIVCDLYVFYSARFDRRQRHCQTADPIFCMIFYCATKYIRARDAVFFFSSFIFSGLLSHFLCCVCYLFVVGLFLSYIYDISLCVEKNLPRWSTSAEFYLFFRIEMRGEKKQNKKYIGISFWWWWWWWWWWWGVARAMYVFLLESRRISGGYVSKGTAVSLFYSLKWIAQSYGEVVFE